MTKIGWAMLSLAIILTIIFGALVTDRLLAPIGGIIPKKRTSIDRDMRRIANLNGIVTGVMLYCVTEKKFPESRGSGREERISNLFSDLGSNFLTLSYLTSDDGLSDANRYDFRSNSPYSGVVEVHLESSDKTRDYSRLQGFIKYAGASLPECTGARICKPISCEEDLKK